MEPTRVYIERAPLRVPRSASVVVPVRSITRLVLLAFLEILAMALTSTSQCSLLSCAKLFSSVLLRKTDVNTFRQAQLNNVHLVGKSAIAITKCIHLTRMGISRSD